MRIIATSDMHGKLAQATLPAGDALVLAGDLLEDAPKDCADPVAWQAERLRELDAYLADLPFEAVLLIAGNHDLVLQERPDLGRALRGARYLEDAGCEVEGVRFWGSPWQPGLCHHPFFLADGGPAFELYRRIPAGTDVLITHTPPWGILDAWDPPTELGSRMLRARVAALRPRVHIFGHMHPSYGAREVEGTRFYNAALCDDEGRPVNPPHIIDL
jgi:Icc-related predicted phosphoesterase